MNKNDYIFLLKDKRWGKKRKEILKRDNFKCVKCESKKTLQVHHKKYIGNRKPWEYNNMFLEVLCSDCHQKEHEKDLSSFLITEKESRIFVLKNSLKIKKEKRKKINPYRTFENNYPEKTHEREVEMSDFRANIIKMREQYLNIQTKQPKRKS